MCVSSLMCASTCLTAMVSLSLHDALPISGKGLLEGTLQAGTSAVSDKLLDLVGLGGKSAADKGKDTRDYPFLYQRQTCHQVQIGRAVQQECRDRSRMPSSA